MARTRGTRSRKASKSTSRRPRSTRRAPRRKDGIALLKEDHREVEKLFKKFQGLSETAIKTKGRTIQKICTELQVHDEIERAHLYPMTESLDESLTKHALDEHKEVNELIDDIKNTEPDDERMDGLMEELISNVTDHVEEEEKKLFPEMQQAFEKDDLMELGRMLAQTKKQLQSRKVKAA
jgi:hemerythrin superfamily protein